jgi:hypothetical protein
MGGLEIGVDFSYSKAAVVPAGSQTGGSPRFVVVGTATPLEEERDVRENAGQQVLALLSAVGDFNSEALEPIRQFAIDLDWLVGPKDHSRELAVHIIDTAREFLEGA